MAADLVEAIAAGDHTSRSALVRRMASATIAADVELADLLDALALRAATSPAALEALLDVIEHGRLAQPAIRRLVILRSDADDVQQDVLIAVAGSIHQYRAEARFTTWLHRVARNTTVGFLRRRRDVGVVYDDEPAPVGSGCLR